MKKFRTRNLIDSNTAQGYLRSTGTYESGSVALVASGETGYPYHYKEYVLKNGVTYTVSAKGVSTDGANCYLQALYVLEDGTYPSISLIQGTDLSLTFTPQKECLKIRINFGIYGSYHNAGTECTFTEMQLEVGEVATKYVPYEVELQAMIYNGQEVNTWIHNGIKVYKSVVDTAISLLVSNKSFTGNNHPYSLNANIYNGIDMSLYNGVQFYVNSASIGCNFSGYNTNLRVLAFLKGTDGDILNNPPSTNYGVVIIASANKNASGVETKSSQAGKTLTLRFTQSEGIVDLWVQGSNTGATSNGGSWQLSNAILLAR